ncbi:MAG TPA: tRNA pseudouridine(55) synthase TruB, partial [Thermomicrobiales bacterium]|nr:tRNA pseudouridine(55) synthase TruB [Thermomicrobiales bacterium]
MARKRTPPRRSGFLNIDKPPGWTSHDVVARVRRVVGERQVGHAGTLDPAASGVLPVAIGHATKVLPFIEDASKTYVAVVRFGVATDSGDRDGRLRSSNGHGQLELKEIEQALDAFRGEIVQVPPMHSAIKVEGKKLYDLARKGVVVDVPRREVTIHAIEVVGWAPPDATIRVECSAGTYIRSLARDLGETVHTCAMLANLIRTRSGKF